MEVSAKTNINIEKAFYRLARMIKERLIDASASNAAPQNQPGIPVDGGAKGPAGNCC